MSAVLSAAGPARAPLLGHNLVRLLYLDEAGTDHKHPWLGVAGVLVHGDHQWPQVNARLDALRVKYIPETERSECIFHATDIYHGSGYYDRRKPDWEDQNKRWGLLEDIAAIIDDLILPLVVGIYQKERMRGLLPPQTPNDERDMLQNMAAMDCLIRADKWLEKFAPTELATVVHEDGTKAKQRIKKTVKALRGSKWVDELSEEDRERFNLPLRRIIDTVHFAEKQDALPLQLADLCAFVMGRDAKGQHVPEKCLTTVFKHLHWIKGVAPLTPPTSSGQAE